MKRRHLPQRLCPCDLERLEERVLLSAAATTAPLALLPNESTITSPKFSDQWYLRNTGQTLSSHPSGPAAGKAGADIGAVNAWNLSTGSKNVVVAVFDTGVDLSQPDLVNNIWHNPAETANGLDDDHDGFVDDLNGWNFVDNNNNVQDTSFTGHGTLVAGVIGAQGNNGLGITGVNWNVSILPIKVATDTGVSDSALQQGIAYVEMLKSRGVNIVAINASYVSFGFPSIADINAIASTANYGILYVAAAGNSGLNFDSLIPGGFLPSNMMLVAATDNQDNLASFSDYGANSVELGAPGVDILTTVRGGFYGMFSGTSFSAPMVAGAAALLKAYAPNATMQQIQNAIIDGATPDPALAGKTITGKRLNAFGALEVLVGNRQPIGHVESLSKAGVSGWAFDYNAGIQPVAVAVLIDGKFAAATSASTPRNDLAAAFGSPGHGFSFASSLFSNLSAGNHTVQVYAIDIPGAGPQLPPALIGSGVVQGPQPPIGNIDLFNATTLAGWALDLDTPSTAVTLRIDVDATTVGTPTASLARSDLQKAFGSANHGFLFTLPTPLAPGFHRLDLFAQDTSTHALTYLGSKEVNTNVAPIGSLDLFNGHTLAGWAFDANAGATPIQIRYQLDNNAPQLVTASVSRSDLQSYVGSTNHGFSITLPQLAAGSHTVTVWAVDPDLNAVEAFLGTRTIRITSPAGNPLPIGNIDVAATTHIAGWAYDASTPADPIQVRIDIDGTPGTPFTANLARADLIPTLHHANFGFDQSLSLTPGPHRIDVYALDASTSTPVLLKSLLVGNLSPAATAITSLTPTLVTGAATQASARLILTINGIDALAATSDANGHFSIPLPHLLPGPYQITVYALDPLTLATSANTPSQSITITGLL
ncbi:MAG TPA: S8 family peptidase [Phycisphaerae bacterium]|nr:S8 family peptidase [Phycisphaerae bacterium]